MLTIIRTLLVSTFIIPLHAGRGDMCLTWCLPKIKMKRIFTTLLILLFPALLFAQEIPYKDSVSTQEVPEKEWGIALGLRSAEIPYKAKDERVLDVIPLLFYDGDIFFVRGLSGGIKLYNEDAWQVSLLGRYRYFDIPSDYQNVVQRNSLDMGIQVKYRITDDFEANVELMSDDYSRYYFSLTTNYHWESGSWELFPYATLRYKSAYFNDYYYGPNAFPVSDNPPSTVNNELGSGFDLTFGTEVRYHVFSNLYLLGRAQMVALDSNTRDSVSIESGTYSELYLGLGFFNNKTKKKTSPLKAKPYIRLAHGWGTPSSIGNILSGNIENDEQNSQISSIFYGHPVADSLFGFDPIDIYITVGYIYHHNAGTYRQTLEPGTGINTPDMAKIPENSCDGNTPCDKVYYGQSINEYVLVIKAYYNIIWPFHWRLGFSQGLSYVDDVSDLEQIEMDEKGYLSSNLMSHLDITIDMSIGDIFGIAAIDDVFLGTGIHHRSAIFEASSAFGRIKGGSNYNSFYLQYHF